MPGYCKEALTRFRHELKKTNDQPHKHVIPNYSANIQYAIKEDTTPAVGEETKTFIQQVTETFQYYAHGRAARTISTVGSTNLSTVRDTYRTTVCKIYIKIFNFIDLF